MNKKATVFIVPNTSKENEAIIEMLQQNGITVMVSNQAQFESTTWQNVEGRIRYDVTNFQNQHARARMPIDAVISKVEYGSVKDLLNKGWDAKYIKTIAEIHGVNIEGDPLYQGCHYITTPEQSALEQIVADFGIDPTFDQMLSGIYARGGAPAVIDFGKQIGMRQDEVMIECVKLNSHNIDNAQSIIDALNNGHIENGIINIQNSDEPNPDLLLTITGARGIAYTDRYFGTEFYGTKEMCDIVFAATSKDFQENHSKPHLVEGSSELYNVYVDINFDRIMQAINEYDQDIADQDIEPIE